MKKLRKQCIDCGSDAVETLIDEIKPNFRMEVVQYACGAVMKSSFSTRSNLGWQSTPVVRKADSLLSCCRNDSCRATKDPSGHKAAGFFCVL